MGSITLIKFISANTFCEFAESITRWKCAKRKCKTFQLSHHRVIESLPSARLLKSEREMLDFALQGCPRSTLREASRNYEKEARYPIRLH
jgi:hypothetical protein